MNIVIRVVMALAAFLIGAASVAPPAGAADQSANSSTTQVSDQVAKKATDKGGKKSTKRVCAKTPGSYTTTNNITVLTNKMCFDVKILKKMGCDTEAGKIERPAPPRDPKSKCKGKAVIHFKIDYKTQCPPDWFGGSLRLFLNIRQKVGALGLSKSIASGRVDTWARTHLKLKDRFKIRVANDCAQLPPPPPPTVTYSAPTVGATAQSCVKQGEQTGAITVMGVNPNSVAATGTFTLGNKPPQTFTVGAGQSVSANFSGFAPGLYSGTFSLGAPINLTAGFTAVVQECEKTTTNNPAPKATGPTVNDVLVNNERDMTFSGKLAKGTTGKATFAAGTGTIVGDRTVTLVVDADGYFTVTVRYRAGDEPGRDTVTLLVEQSDGQSVSATTMGRDAAGNPVPDFEVRAAPVDPQVASNK